MFKYGLWKIPYLDNFYAVIAQMMKEKDKEVNHEVQMFEISLGFRHVLEKTTWRLEQEKKRSGDTFLSPYEKFYYYDLNL